MFYYFFISCKSLFYFVKLFLIFFIINKNKFLENKFLEKPQLKLSKKSGKYNNLQTVHLKYIMLKEQPRKGITLNRSSLS